MRKLASFKYIESEPKVALTVRNDRGNDKIDVTRFESNDPPKVELEKALQAMCKHLVEICEFPEEWVYDITVRGVTVRYGKGGRMGLVIRGVKELAYSRTPLAVNTPYHQEEFDDDSEDDDESEEGSGVELSVFGPDCKKDLERLEELALAYLDGDRRQLVLFREDGSVEDAEVVNEREAEPVGVEQ